MLSSFFDIKPAENCKQPAQGAGTQGAVTQGAVTQCAASQASRPRMPKAKKGKSKRSRSREVQPFDAGLPPLAQFSPTKSRATAKVPNLLSPKHVQSESEDDFGPNLDEHDVVVNEWHECANDDAGADEDTDNAEHTDQDDDLLHFDSEKSVDAPELWKPETRRKSRRKGVSAVPVYSGPELWRDDDFVDFSD